MVATRLVGGADGVARGGVVDAAVDVEASKTCRNSTAFLRASSATTCTRAPGTAADGEVAASASSHTPPDTSGCWACSAWCQWRLLVPAVLEALRYELIVKPGAQIEQHHAV